MAHPGGRPSTPRPPAAILEHIESTFVPDLDLCAFVMKSIILESGEIHNPDHSHLEGANLGFLWTNSEAKKRGRRILGTAEEAKFLCAKWHKDRQEQQMREWFGVVPNFVITLDANYCAECSDAELLALIEHELYHCGQKMDPFGQPRFSEDGAPVFELRGHDVEEFVGVVRRYGIGNDEKLAEMVRYAQKAPDIDHARASTVCGNCLR